jgi:hypothetical protein
MFCESYRQPLSEAACFGEELPRELAAHLVACNECASAFAAEQALFSSVDRSLHAAANADVPASVVSGVREALSQKETPVWHFQWRAILAFGSACLIAATLSYRHSRSASQEEKTPAVASAVASTESQQVKTELLAGVTPTTVRTSRRRSQRNLRPRETATRIGPEVIVAPEEQAALKKYAVIVNARTRKNSDGHATTLEVRADIKPLEIAEINLHQLAIQPLEGVEDVEEE